MELDDVTLYIVYAIAAGTGHHAGRGGLHAAVVRRGDAQGDQPPHAAAGRNVNQKEVLVQLRKERGLDGQGARFSPMAALRELRIQSGMVMPLTTFLIITTQISLAIGIGGGLMSASRCNSA
jgi:tight adherence protein B